MSRSVFRRIGAVHQYAEVCRSGRRIRPLYDTRNDAGHLCRRRREVDRNYRGRSHERYSISCIRTRSMSIRNACWMPSVMEVMISQHFISCSSSLHLEVLHCHYEDNCVRRSRGVSPSSLHSLLEAGSNTCVGAGAIKQTSPRRGWRRSMEGKQLEGC